MPDVLQFLQAGGDRSDGCPVIQAVTRQQIARQLNRWLREGDQVADADELFGAIALATIGGTVAGTIGALVFVPALLPQWRLRIRSRTT